MPFGESSNKPRSLAVIAARGGSKGVPGKNLRLLGGRPLISYMIEAARKAKLIDRVIVSTEDDKIAGIAREWGAEVPFQRPKELADDHTPLIAVAKHCMEKMDQLGYRADIVIQLSPTCPFISERRIDESVQLVLNGADSAASLKKIEHEHPYRARRVDQEGNFTYFITHIDVERFQSRQDLPELYCTSGAIYTRRRRLLENWSGYDFALGKVARAIILDEIEGINIDRPIDFLFAEFIMSRIMQK